MNLSEENKSVISQFHDNKTIQSEYSSRDQENGYEPIIVKLEEEIRNHIRIEQTLKLHLESQENKIEEIEKENQVLKEKNVKLIEVLIKRN